MLLFIPRSLCALKRVAAKAEHSRFGATQGIRIALASGVYRVEACDGRRAIVVHGLTPLVDPPWPGFKELPDDACEAIILPKDLERACNVGEEVLQRSFDMVGLATTGNGMCLGIGADVVTARTVEGRFPKLEQAVPKKRPLFSFRIDPKLVAETLLAIADLLPEGDRGVQCFYYGDGLPLGFCARNGDNGMLIDALVVPFKRARAGHEAATSDSGVASSGGGWPLASGSGWSFLRRRPLGLGSSASDGLPSVALSLGSGFGTTSTLGLGSWPSWPLTSWGAAASGTAGSCTADYGL
jgi:hypothetical protein